jgi:uncharacterized membrane protein
MSQTIISTKEKSIMLFKSAVIFLSTIAWRDVIQAIFKKIYPHNHDTISGKLIYAIVITAGVVIFLTYFENFQKQNNNIKNKK